MERTKEIPILGATGDHPEGKLNQEDEGGFQFQVAADQLNKKVVINFGPKPIQWIGMNPADARGLANLLMHVADHAELPLGEAPPNIIKNQTDMPPLVNLDDLKQTH
jgi:hypothetical protein